MGFWSALGGAALQIAPTIMNSLDAHKNRELQKDAMYKGIQIRVEDAKRAGIHPLAALGAQTYTPSPVNADYSSLSQLGQQVSQKARLTKESQLIDAQIELLKAQANKENNLASSLSGSGQGTAITHDPSNDQTQGQLLPDNVGLFSMQNIDSQGRVWETPSQGLQEAVSDEAPFTTQMSYEWSILSDKAKAWLVQKFPRQAASGGELGRFYDNWIKTRPYEKGYIYRWDFLYGWVRHKADGSNALFVVDAPAYRSSRLIPKADLIKSKHKEFPGWQGK